MNTPEESPYKQCIHTSNEFTQVHDEIMAEYEKYGTFFPELPEDISKSYYESKINMIEFWNS